MTAGMSRSEIIIVGGGVIGLSVAYALAREGIAAMVLDRGELGRAASWAGAGIIAPASNRETNPPWVELRSLSARTYPEWSESLREETGLDNGYRRSGGVDVAGNEEEARALDESVACWRAEAIAFERLGPSEFARVEPMLNPELHSAYFLPDRAQIRNPRHLRALALALEQRGARLRPGVAAVGFESKGRRVTAVQTPEGRVPCEAVVVAAGPWTAALLDPLGIRIRTPPIKGQIVLLRCDPPRLRRIVEHGKNYLVPRDDGRVLAGATEEDAGFDTRPTPVAIRDLIDEALRLCPILAEAEVERAWAGLRPGSLDTRPYLGRAPAFDNLIVASGHKRAGLQLAPGTALVVADMLLNRPPRIDVDPFRLDRKPSAAEGAEAFRS
jgi:glycine oxidase